MENIISVKSLQKSFGKLEVLKDVTFDVKKGSIFALLGSNGAGKTTAVKILSTLILPSGGKAEICEYDVVKNATFVRKEISLTGQFSAIDEVLTGRENLKIIGKLKRISDLDEKIKNWLTTFNLEKAADRKVIEYSGGMKRRLDIAMSLLGDPKIIFLDEPTTGLDPQSRIAMWILVKNLAKNGSTVFLTTQHLEEAEELADEIAVLHSGRIIASGTSDHLKSIMPNRGAVINFEENNDAEKAMKILESNNIQTSGLSQKLPSLEDVFLTLIGEKKEGTDND